MPVTLDDFVITFTDETHEETCQQSDGCSNVALWKVTWKHIKNPRDCPSVILYCNSHLEGFKQNQHDLGIGAVCTNCWNSLTMIDYRPLKA